VLLAWVCSAISKKSPCLILIIKMNLICENLYLGDQSAALSLDLLHHHGITHVLNVTDSVPNLFRPLIEYLQIKASDEETQDLLSAFVTSIEFIDEARATGKVLVHC
jgi:protein-tyrosine phosphatase